MYNGSLKACLLWDEGVAIGPNPRKTSSAEKSDFLVVGGKFIPTRPADFWGARDLTDEMKQSRHRLQLACADLRERRLMTIPPLGALEEYGVPTPGDARLDQAVVAQIFLKFVSSTKKKAQVPDHP